jgi:hypothetical protein
MVPLVIDTYGSRQALPSNAVPGTIALVTSANTVTFYAFIAGVGWTQAATGASR